MNRAKAKQYTLVSQVTAAMLALAAVALGVLDRPHAPADTGGPGTIGPTTPEVAPTPALPRADIELISVSFQPNGPPMDEPKDTAADTGEKPPPPPPAPNELRYLGSIMGLGKRMAFVSHEGVQHLVSEGKAVGDFTILEVRRDSIVVDGPAGEQTIDKADRTGDPITTASLQPVVNNLIGGRNSAAAMREARDRVNRGNPMTAEDRVAQDAERKSKLDQLRAESEARRRGAQVRPNGTSAPPIPIEDAENREESDSGEEGP